MSLVDQIFEQARVGTHLPVSNAFMQGVQAGQHQQALDVQKQQVAMEIAQMPLKQTLLQQHTALNQYSLTHALEQQQATIEARKAVAEFAPLASKYFQAGKPEDAQAAWLDTLSRYPRAGEDPEFMKYPGLIANSVNAKLELQKLKSNEFTGPETKTINDPDLGPITFAREGPNSWKPIQDNTVEVKTPDGTVVRQTLGGGARGKTAPVGGLQPAVATELEKKIAANERSISLLDESLGAMSPSTVGGVGAVNEFAEQVGNVLKPGSMPTTAIAARQTFRATAQNLYSSLKADSQINKIEAAAMKEIADVTSLKESSPGAQRKYGILRDLTALQNVLMNHQMGRFATDASLRVMSPEQAARAWKRGDLTNAEIEKWNELHQFVK